MLGREVLHPIDLMLHPGGEEDQGPPGTYVARHQQAMRTVHQEFRQKLQQSQRLRKTDYDLRLKKENTLYVMRFIDLTGLLCCDNVKDYSPFGGIPGL